MLRIEELIDEHRRVSRRFLLQFGAGVSFAPWLARDAHAVIPAGLDSLVADLDSFYTPQNDFRDVSRGDPLPHTLSAERKRHVGMARETWSLEVDSDPEHPVDIRRPLTARSGNAFDFSDLMEVAKTKAVRFGKVMTCLNIAKPLGMGLWEGVPLREVFWLTKPRKDVRRAFYYGYHNDKPEQMFRSSLPINRILEDPMGLPPVILCYKLNGEWLTSERGGPVRVVVPEAYGFKSIKWLSHIVLTNLFHANDTYAEGNNDIESDLKTFSATLFVSSKVRAGERIPVTGFAQVGTAGLAKVQVRVRSEDQEGWGGAMWHDAKVLASPAIHPTGESNGSKKIFGFERETGQPSHWPQRLTRIHWAVTLPGLPAGSYELQSRTIDDNGHAQPMPRPFQKSGHARLEEFPFAVES